MSKHRFLVMGYLGVVLLAFAPEMGMRLLASAHGRAIDMSVREVGALDWGEPFLRDPVFFLSLACPVMIAAIVGLWYGSDWGRKTAALSCTWILTILTLILFTGPLKEALLNGAVSGPVLTMSAAMVVAGLPAIWSLISLASGEARHH